MHLTGRVARSAPSGIPRLVATRGMEPGPRQTGEASSGAVIPRRGQPHDRAVAGEAYATHDSGQNAIGTRRQQQRSPNWLTASPMHG